MILNKEDGEPLSQEEATKVVVWVLNAENKRYRKSLESILEILDDWCAGSYPSTVPNNRIFNARNIASEALGKEEADVDTNPKQ